MSTAFYLTKVKTDKAIHENNEVQSINQKQEIVKNNFVSIISDLMILSAHHELYVFLESNGPVHRKNVSKEFLEFCYYKSIYDQVRLLDGTGMEVVRVDFNNGKPRIIQDEQLQFKGSRYYFIEILQLEQGEIFVSPFDLNIERGEIEQPLKPIIRIGTPVFDSKGQKCGIVVLNYLGKKLIRDLERAFTGSPGHIMLLNSEGYWMKGLKPEDEWGFMYDEKKDRTIGNVYPEVWERISREESGQFYSEEGLFTFTTIYPLLESMKSNTVLYEDIYNSNVRNVRRKPKDAFWKVVSYVPANLTNVGAHLFLLELLTVNFLLFVLYGSGSWSMARASVRRKMAERKVMESLKEKEILLREVHHRVKNNMQVISSMLNLQSRAVGNDKCTEIFKECTSRIRSMSLIHEKLYLSENLASIDFGDYVENLAKTLYRSYSLRLDRITLNIDVKNIHIDLDTAIPCGLIINELISNSLKYAFPPDFKKGKSEINISLRKTGTVLRDGGKNEEEYELMVSDNGIGFHKHVDFSKAETMGLQLVSILAEGQLGGKIELNKIEGTEFKFRFKA